MKPQSPLNFSASGKTWIWYLGCAMILLSSGCEPKVAPPPKIQTPPPNNRPAHPQGSLPDFSFKNKTLLQIVTWDSEVSKLDTASILGILKKRIGEESLREAEALTRILARKAPTELADYILAQQDEREIDMVYSSLATMGSAPGAVTGLLASNLDTQARQSALKEYCNLLRLNPAVQTEFKEILQGLAAVDPPFLRRRCLNLFIGGFDEGHIESAWQNALATVPPEDLADVASSVIGKLSLVPDKATSVLGGLDQLIEHSPSEALIAVHRSAVTSWLQRDTNPALTYLNSLRPSPAKDQLIMNAVSELSRNGENAAAVEWIKQITDRELQERAALDLPKLK